MGKEIISKNNFKKKFLKEYINGVIIDSDMQIYNNKDKLIYEGKHFQGKRNGKGKNYNNEGNLIFEGEYSNNHKIRGKTYFPNGKIEFEGDFLFDRKWKGKGYDEEGNLIYELIKGNGKVREYNSKSELIFEGEYLNGKRNGKGKEYENGELIFEGEYLNDNKIENIQKQSNISK